MMLRSRQSIKQTITKIKTWADKLVLPYKISFFISLALFYLTTLGDSIAFQPAGMYWTNPTYYVVKFIILVLFIFLSQFVPHLYYRMRSGDEYARRYIHYFLIYAAVMSIIWLLIYPGSSHNVDEAYVLLGARTLDITLSWHHFLTVVWYAIGLGIFPSLAAITFVEYMFISAIVAYIMAQFHKVIRHDRAQLLFYFFLIPSVLVFNLTPLRLSVYAFLETLVFFIILKTYFGQGVISLKLLIFLGFLMGTIASIRPESIVYVVLLPIVMGLLFVRARRISWRNLALFTTIAIVSFVSLNFFQNLNARDKLMYQVTAIMEPLSTILKGGNFNYNNKAQAKSIIDEAIDYDRLVAGENANDVYWSRVDRSLTEAELSSLKALYIHLIFDNPVKFAKGCVKNFLKSNALWPDLSKDGKAPVIDYRFTENLIAYRPISEKTRDVTLVALRAVAYDYSHYTPMTRVINSATITIMALIALAIYMVRRRDILVILLIPLTIKNVIIFLTAPLPSFYYYYPLQLTGTVFVVVYLIAARTHITKKNVDTKTVIQQKSS